MINDYLQNFIKVINEKIDPDNLKNMKRNINTLDYRVRKFNPHYSFSGVVSGIYDSKKNRIDIYEDDPSIIYHELLHMASSKYINKKRYEGFCDMSLDIDNSLIGVALNEGYTELLARRLFDIKSNVCNGYEYAVYIASLIEKIVGKENMIRYYFTANLPGLIDELSLYSNKDDIISFLEESDFVLESLDKLIIKFRKEKVWDFLVDINKFLATSYANKMYNFYKNKEITKDELVKKMFVFNDSLIDDKYEITTKEDINNYLNEVFSVKDNSIISEYKLIRIKEN